MAASAAGNSAAQSADNRGESGEPALLAPALDPVFVLGMQRSGTSILAIALQELGLFGFAEGHLWQRLVATLEELRDPRVGPKLRRPHFALGSARYLALEQEVARAIDAFHRAEIPVPEGARWFDKSPSAYNVRRAPLLAELFPGAQFVFIHRDPRAVLRSGQRIWGSDPALLDTLCRGWDDTMRAWRTRRGDLGSRGLEIAHAELVAEPDLVASRLCGFLGQARETERIEQLFRTRRQNSSYPDRAPGDYRPDGALDPALEAQLLERCAAEMRRWGYPLQAEADAGERRDERGLAARLRTRVRRRGARGS